MTVKLDRFYRVAPSFLLAMMYLFVLTVAIQGSCAFFFYANQRKCVRSGIGRLWKCGGKVIFTVASTKETQRMQTNFEISGASARSQGKKKPPGFWNDMENVKMEICAFWSSISVPIRKSESNTPPIPSNALLDYFERYDLKHGIVANGGRKVLSNRMGGARIIPGKWREAVNEVEVGILLKSPSGNGLSRAAPPLAPYRKKRLMDGWGRNPLNSAGVLVTFGEEAGAMDAGKLLSPCVKKTTVDGGRYHGGKPWAHRKERRRRGYWNREKILSELYDFLATYGEAHKRPAIWMPRMSELTTWGRDDLRLAIVRDGGIDGLCRHVGLIPYGEWTYFESLYDLIVELKQYLERYYDGKEDILPESSQMLKRGEKTLYNLIQRHGGRKYVARRFDMQYLKHRKETAGGLWDDIRWGPFSLEFAINLMGVVRGNMMQRYLPTSNESTIRMPTRAELESMGGEGVQLAESVTTYGGFENVARRLGLAWAKEDSDPATSSIESVLSHPSSKNALAASTPDKVRNSTP